MSRGQKVSRSCARCGALFQARTADVKRGWGRYCSKSCKASAQEARTGQYRAYVHENSGEPQIFFGGGELDQ